MEMAEKTKSGNKLKKHDLRLLKRLLPYLKQHFILLTLTVVFMLLMDITGVLYPFLIKIGIDRDIMGGDFPALQKTSMLLLAVLAAVFLFQVLFNYAVQYLGQRLLFDLRLNLFKKVLSLSNEFFDRTAVGKTMTNVTNDVEAFREFISEGIVTVVGELLKVIFILVAMMVINMKLAILAFVMIPVFIVVTILFRKSIRTGYRGVRKANARINTSLQESITGIREIFQFNYKEKSLDNFEQANQYYLVSFLKIIHAYALYFPVIEVVSNVSMIIIFLFAHRALGVSVNLGEIFAFFVYINMFFRPLRQLAERFNMFQAAMAAAERIFKLLDQPVVVKNLEKPISVLKKLKGKISFRNVNFRYRENNLVLKNVSFDINPGEKVAIVGHTGSGKTTIINLLNRFYNIQSGDILVDDIPIEEYDIFALRSHIVTIPQDPFFFTGTVAENISMYDPNISLEEITYVSKQVYADRFIERLPKKYQENILEEGKRLSIGERQLLSFARGLLRNPSLFILDEATSNIDSATENLIEAAIDNLLKDRTGIIIAHRLSTIRKVDRILVLNKGCLVEDGSHNQLLKNGGIYSRLYKAQAFSAS